MRQNRPPAAGLTGTRPGDKIGRVDVSETASISSGIADRYASAVFDLVKEDGALDTLESDVGDLSAAIADSDDMRALIESPVLSRREQEGAIAAIADKMGLMPVMQNTLRLMATKRRLFVLPHMLARLRDRLAAERGEITADVATATALTDDQMARLSKTLSDKVGKTVKIKATVDETLIGGLVVKVGSKMIDSSIRAKLASLQNAMKEVG